jgi:thiol-disulfide isomerase/thioredoxin
MGDIMPGGIKTSRPSSNPLKTMQKLLLCVLLLSFTPLLHADVDLTKPLQLSFTSVAGQSIDISKMRGKVVLVDFWATWCPPCRAEVPDVVATYKKYHDQGFEVVGISLDQDKDALLSFTKENGMVWPQYFDGSGFDNKIASNFGIQEIPTMWLVGKDGVIITTNGRDDLAGQVAKALAAK